MTPWITLSLIFDRTARPKRGLIAMPILLLVLTWDLIAAEIVQAFAVMKSP
jgi:hypothetical protein